MVKPFSEFGKEFVRIGWRICAVTIDEKDVLVVNHSERFNHRASFALLGLQDHLCPGIPGDLPCIVGAVAIDDKDIGKPSPGKIPDQVADGGGLVERWNEDADLFLLDFHWDTIFKFLLISACMHIAKKGLRILGIAESFSGSPESVLAGVVMRKDLRIDGFRFTTATVGGMDATESIVGLYHSFERSDINLLMISGSVISWYNIIDPGKIFEKTERPVIVVTYEDSEGLEDDIARHFPGDLERLGMYRRLGPRTRLELETGYSIYLRATGIGTGEAGRLCRQLTFDGKMPEPLRVARLLARSVMQYTSGGR